MAVYYNTGPDITGPSAAAAARAVVSEADEDLLGEAIELDVKHQSKLVVVPSTKSAAGR
eukprot:COSAG04_NODE_560_length_12599_cov_40.846640_3_plen_59_part_00